MSPDPRLTPMAEPPVVLDLLPQSSTTYLLDYLEEDRFFSWGPILSMLSVLVGREAFSMHGIGLRDDLAAASLLSWWGWRWWRMEL